MTMSPRVRKFALTAHVVCSVGWLGAVASTTALAVVGLTSQDAEVVRAVYIALEPTGWFVLLPLSLLSLLTGLVQSLGTSWGLFRHYWVLFKLMINVVASVVLLMYMETLAFFAGVAAQTTWSSADIGVLRNVSPLLHASLALLLLVAAATLSVYKPQGRTRYGRLKQELLAVSRP